MSINTTPNPGYEAYLAKQEGIFNNNRVVTAAVGDSVGLEKDPGTDAQRAFLVAWRFDTDTARRAEEFSRHVASLTPSFIYRAEIVHNTLSDLDLKRGAAPDINPEVNPDEAETIDLLAASVKRGLGRIGLNGARGAGVDFRDAIIMGGSLDGKGGKSVVIAGVPTEVVWEINQAVIEAAGNPADGRPIDLKGAWGSHMTTNRFLTASSPAEARGVGEYVRGAAYLGNARPTSIDVGYFNVDEVRGFDYETVESIEL